MKARSGGYRIGMLAVLVAIMGAATDPATAADRQGFYLTADYGKFRFTRDRAPFDIAKVRVLECYVADVFHGTTQCSQPADAPISPDDRKNRVRTSDLWVGYQFSRWFAVEGTYLDMGKTRYPFTGLIGLGDVDGDGTDDGLLQLRGKGSLDMRGPAFAVVGTLPLGNNASLNVRAGFMSVSSELRIYSTVTLPAGPQRFPYAESDNKTAFFFGANANLWITRRLAVRGGYTLYGEGPYDERPVVHFYAGLRYQLLER